jgi:iron-sulfur cluster repair protein YtfE (RIC family)
VDSIRDLLSADHRQCDALFVAVEHSLAAAAWGEADAAYARLRAAMRLHFDAEEAVLFPAFEAHTGMRMGPTQVMRNEHAQMSELLDAAGAALEQRDAEEYAGNAETLLIMMQQHNMKEENVLYPMSDQHLASQLGALLPQLQSRIAGDRAGL